MVYKIFLSELFQLLNVQSSLLYKPDLLLFCNNLLFSKPKQKPTKPELFRLNYQNMSSLNCSIVIFPYNFNSALVSFSLLYLKYFRFLTYLYICSDLRTCFNHNLNYAFSMFFSFSTIYDILLAKRRVIIFRLLIDSSVAVLFIN